MQPILRSCNLYYNGKRTFFSFMDDAHAKSNQSEYNITGIVTFKIREKRYHRINEMALIFTVISIFQYRVCYVYLYLILIYII